jgi:hypothetical protein
MAKKRTHTPKRPWVKMEPAVPVLNKHGRMMKKDNGEKMWMNDRYTVISTPLIEEMGMKGPVHLSIRHNDRTKWLHDWRHLQRIKNDICGSEREAIELYPAESRLVDQANQFHLWVLAEGESVPVGWNARTVYDLTDIDDDLVGAAQRPHDDDVERNPPTREELEQAVQHLTTNGE